MVRSEELLCFALGMAASRLPGAWETVVHREYPKNN